MENIGSFLLLVLLYSVFYVFAVLPFYFLVNKSGRDKAYQAMIPIMNIFVLVDIVKKPKWVVILFFIPGVNLLLTVFYYTLFLGAFKKGNIAIIMSGVLIIIATITMKSGWNLAFLALGYGVLLAFSVYKGDEFGGYIGHDMFK